MARALRARRPGPHKPHRQIKRKNLRNALDRKERPRRTGSKHAIRSCYCDAKGSRLRALILGIRFGLELRGVGCDFIGNVFQSC